MRRPASLFRQKLYRHALFRYAFVATLALAVLAPAAVWAGEAAISVTDAYARAPSPAAPAAAVYIDLANAGDSDDLLVDVASDVAARVELHSVETDDQGMTRMVHMADGATVPAGGALDMGRGGLHVMLMGLRAPLEQGESVDIVLTFRDAGEIRVTVPVDHARSDSGSGTGDGMMQMDGAADH